MNIENGELVDLSQKDYVIPDSVEEKNLFIRKGKGTPTCVLFRADAKFISTIMIWR